MRGGSWLTHLGQLLPTLPLLARPLILLEEQGVGIDIFAGVDTPENNFGVSSRYSQRPCEAEADLKRFGKLKQKWKTIHRQLRPTIMIT